MNTLFTTPKDFLKIKKAPNHSFFYTERKGIDSVAIILADTSSAHKGIGLINEAKPPFNERENVEMSFKVSALGGSLFDQVNTEAYLAMSDNDQQKIALKVAEIETKEESGYTPIRSHYVGKFISNSMSNEYFHGVLVEVDTNEIPKPDPQSPTEALASVVWFEDMSDGIDIECAKALAIIAKASILNLDIGEN